MKKMVKKLLGIMLLVIVLGVLSGCSVVHTITGNKDLMLNYIDDKNLIIADVINLNYQEEELLMHPDTTEDEIIAFTENIIVPTLENIISDLRSYSEQINNDKLREVDEIHIQAFELRLTAEKNWLENKDDTTYEEMIQEVEEIENDYESKIENLAKQWGVTIQWEYE